MTAPSTKVLVAAVVAAVTLACCLGVVGGGVWLYTISQDAKEPARAAAEEFIQDLADADYAGAYDRLCQQTRDQFSRDAFEQGARSQPRIRRYDITTVSVSTVDGRATGLVGAELVFDNGKTDRHTFRLARDGGDWKVCGQPY